MENKEYLDMGVTEEEFAAMSQEEQEALLASKGVATSEISEDSKAAFIPEEEENGQD